MNYPEGVSDEEVREFWGSITPEDREWIKNLRNREKGKEIAKCIVLCVS
jgi:hypothetical protein